MSEGFIDGLYNYCDRWCERCLLTARCRVFAFEEQRKHTDDENAAFWQMFDDLASGEPSPRAEEMLSGESADDERYLPELDEWDGDEGEQHERPIEKIRESDPAVRLANGYGMDVHDWLKQHADLAESHSEESRNNPPASENVGREDALEIVAWYAFQIAVKLTRALSNARRLEEETRYDAEEDEYEDDWKSAAADEDDDIREAMIDVSASERDGSAKVSLIGIERSLGAWTILRDHYPHQVDTIRDFQKTLARLRRHIDQQIPGARTFQRPGFEYEV